VPLSELGRAVDPAELVPGLVPLPRDEDGALVGEILWVDRYGNCQLNIDPEQIDGWGERVQLRWTRPSEGVRTARRITAFDELAPGQVGLVTDSYGLLAVAVTRGSAADTLGLATGDELALVPLIGAEGDDAGSGNGADRAAGATSPVTLQPRRPR
jgi:S-adenosylmethionine hydrolase